MNLVMGGFILFALAGVGRYEAVEKLDGKTRCEAMAWQATMKLRKHSKIDVDGNYLDNGMPAYLCVRQKMHFPPADAKGR